MSQTMLPVFENPAQCKAFVHWCNESKARVRILLLSPSPREYSQIIAVGQGMESARSSPDPLTIIPAKIHATIKCIYDNVSRHITDPGLKPSIRFAHCNLPYCLNVIDDEMYVTLYGTHAEGNEQPTFRVQGRDTAAFKTFMREFNAIWSTKSSASPSEDPILHRYRDWWPELLPLRSILKEDKHDPKILLPPPKQAILFLTWRCTAGCSYCMFKEHRSNGVVDMSISGLEDAILKLANYGVRHFEITGGGEPSEHPEIGAVVEMITRLRRANDALHFGLLTNGMSLPNPPDPLLDAFDEYIRISFCETLQESIGRTQEPMTDPYSRWSGNVSRLLAAKRNHPTATTMIGIKLLLTVSNQSCFVNTAARLLGDRNLAGTNHWRLRAARNVEQEFIPDIEQAVFHDLAAVTLPPWDNISLALSHTQYPRNFRCWLSPMQTTIVPDGSVYVCCNFLADQNTRYIGNIHKDGFDSLWNSEKHFRVRKTIDAGTCARECYANCRFAELQTILDPIAAHLGQT
jgi:radical SAM protein with 4Fe4S-binding SPASM domain